MDGLWKMVEHWATYPTEEQARFLNTEQEQHKTNVDFRQCASGCRCSDSPWQFLHILKNWHHTCDVMPAIAQLPSVFCQPCLKENDSSKWLAFYFINNIVIAFLTLKRNSSNVEKASTVKMVLWVPMWLCQQLHWLWLVVNDMAVLIYIIKRDAFSVIHQCVTILQ